MFSRLSEKLQSVLSKVARGGRLTESNISEAVREVRLALLEADVNFKVVKEFIKKVKEAALGEEVIQKVTPGQHFIKVVHDELVNLMGKEEATLNFKEEKPAVMMLCGLQGSGKTTHTAKLAHYLKKDKRFEKPLMVAADLQRPAAIEQLKTLGKQIQVDVFSIDGENDPCKVVKQGMDFAKSNGFDLVIVDTAGRLHIDTPLMEELKEIKALCNPSEVLFVANSTLGQDAVTTADSFHKAIGMTGSILTMLDGDTRGGAALSIRQVTGQPLKFEGIGEKIGDIQIFNPISMADRILGMGDTINLVKQAKEHFDEEKGKELEEKFKKASFTFEDFLDQMGMVKKMGSIRKLLGMLPGLGGKLDFLDASEKNFKTIEAVIFSMTKHERKMDKLSMDRRRRIAKGSGVGLDEVNRLIKTFDQAKKLMKNLPQMKNQMKNLNKFMGGFQ